MGGLPALVVWMVALTDAGLANLRFPDRRGGQSPGLPCLLAWMAGKLTQRKLCIKN